MSVAAAERVSDAVAAIESVEGWLSREQAARLWQRARAVPAGGTIVEIGSYRGRSTIVLARAAIAGVQVVAVDPHAGGDRGPRQIVGDSTAGEADHAAFLENLERAGVSDRVHHLRMRSREALDAVEGPIELLYVDGAHRYQPAREDLERWGARVVPGGTMLVHDAFNAAGVMLAQLRLLVSGGGFRYAGRVRSLAEYRREQVRGRARIANAASQLGELPYFFRNLAIKLALAARRPSLARALGSEEWPY